MKATELAKLPLDKAAPLSLDVLMVYEDLGTGLRARQVLDGTVERLAADADVHVKLWRFDLLGEPSLCHQAVRDAAQADLVFVSAHGHSELPATVSLCLQRWLAHIDGKPCALVVSFDADAGDTPAVFRPRTLSRNRRLTPHQLPTLPSL